MLKLNTPNHNGTDGDCTASLIAFFGGSPRRMHTNPSLNLRIIPACLKAIPDFEHILTFTNTNLSQYFSGRVITFHRNAPPKPSE